MAEETDFRSVPVFGYKDPVTGQLRKDQAGNIIVREAPEGFTYVGLVPIALAMVNWPKFLGLIADLSDECGPVILPKPTFSFAHYDEVADEIAATPASYRGSFEVNNCEKLTGWFVNLSDPNTPQVFGITVDGVLIARVTVQISGRTDVKNSLMVSGVTGITTDLFGFSFLKPATYRDGISHTWGVTGEVAGRPLQIEYNPGGPAQYTCPVPANPTVPYPIQQLIKVGIAVTKGGGEIIASITENMSDGSSRPYAGSVVPVWSVADNPTGIVLDPDNANKSVKIKALQTATVSKIALKAMIGSGQAGPADIQVISSECQREAGLTTYGAAWNFVPAGGGNARDFDTLDDANNTVGAKFDGTGAGELSTFLVQAARLAVGESIYLNGPPATDCTKPSNRIVAMLDTSFGNTVRKAIQINEGKIVAVGDSPYQTPMTVVIEQIAIGRDSSDNITFYYKSTQTGNQYLQDSWTGFDPNNDVWLASGYQAAPVAGRPAGLANFQYQDPYGHTASQTAALQTDTTFRIRKQGQTAVLIQVTFNASTLQQGQTKIIYPQ